jgi:hypothetical protein
VRAFTRLSPSLLLAVHPLKPSHTDTHSHPFALQSLTHTHTGSSLLAGPPIFFRDPWNPSSPHNFWLVSDARLSTSRCPKGIPPPLQLKLCRITQPNRFFLTLLLPLPTFWFASNLYLSLSSSSQSTVNQHTTHSCVTVIFGSVTTARSIDLASPASSATYITTKLYD